MVVVVVVVVVEVVVVVVLVDVVDDVVDDDAGDVVDVLLVLDVLVGDVCAAGFTAVVDVEPDGECDGRARPFCFAGASTPPHGPLSEGARGGTENGFFGCPA